MMKNAILATTFALVLASCAATQDKGFDEWYTEVINEPYTADVVDQ